jgi:hypothetical protein
LKYILSAPTKSTHWSSRTVICSSDINTINLKHISVSHHFVETNFSREPQWKWPCVLVTSSLCYMWCLKWSSASQIHPSDNLKLTNEEKLIYLIPLPVVIYVQWAFQNLLPQCYKSNVNTFY